MSSLTCTGYNFTYSCFDYVVSLQKQAETYLTNNYSTTIVNQYFIDQIGAVRVGSLTLVKFLQLSPSKVLSLYLTFSLAWLDTIVNFTSDTLFSTRFNASLVWTPTLRLFNPATATYQYNVDDTVIYEPNNFSNRGGYKVRASVTAVFDVICDSMDVVRFPFDTQVCSIILISDKINLIQGDSDCSFLFSSSSEWNVTNCIFGLINGNIMNITLNLQRRNMKFVFNMIIPTIIIASINALVFILPSWCGPKIQLAASILLTVNFLLGIVFNAIPQFSSDKIPIILSVVFFVQYASVTSLVESVLLQTLHDFAPGFPKKVNDAVVWLFVTRWINKVDSVVVQKEIPESVGLHLHGKADRLDPRACLKDSDLNERVVAYLEKLNEVVDRQEKTLEKLVQPSADNKKTSEELRQRRVQLAWRRFEYTVNLLFLLGFVGCMIYYFAFFLYM